MGDLYEWDPNSTYVKHPPYFEGMTIEPSNTYESRCQHYPPPPTSTAPLHPFFFFTISLSLSLSIFFFLHF